MNINFFVQGISMAILEIHYPKLGQHGATVLMMIQLIDEKADPEKHKEWFALDLIKKYEFVRRNLGLLVRKKRLVGYSKHHRRQYQLPPKPKKPILPPVEPEEDYADTTYGDNDDLQAE